MKSILLMTTVTLMACATSVTNKNEINYLTEDGVEIIGDLFISAEKSPVILLFHQGGSNGRAEYESIIPRLLGMDCNVLSIDQRVGGQIYGKYNRTVANLSTNEFSYCDALPELLGALDFLNGTQLTGPRILWGSSYSAALVIQLASNSRLKIDRALAFSPSTNPTAMKGCHPNQYFAVVQIPLLVLRPQSEMSERSIVQFEAATQHGHQVYIAENGTHGSSMLVQERVTGDISKNWEIVESFLTKIQ